MAPNPRTALRVAARMASVSHVSHPALAPILSAGREDARTVWFRRQDPGGLGLGQLTNLGTLEPRMVVDAVAAALEAVAALHRAGVVHGALDADAIRVLNDGHVIVVAPPAVLHRGSGKKADLRALGHVLCTLAGPEAGPVGAALAEGQLDDAQTAAWALKGSTGRGVTAPIPLQKHKKGAPHRRQPVRRPTPVDRQKPTKRAPSAWPRVHIRKPEFPVGGMLAALASRSVRSTGRTVGAASKSLMRPLGTAAKWRPELPARAVLPAAAAVMLGLLLVAAPGANLPSTLSGFALPEFSFNSPSGRPQSSTTAKPPAPLPRTAASPVVPTPVASPEQPAPVQENPEPPPPAVAAAPVAPPAPARVAVAAAPQLVRAPTDAGPPAAVARFYALVTAHDFADARQTWSPSMQSRYPAQIYINQRFAATTSIRATQDALVSESGDRATVAVTVVETTASGTRTWVGSWQLVKLNGTWLLDQPNLRAA